MVNPLLSKIQNLITPLLDSINLKLWGLEFLPGGRSVLRIFIERATPLVAEGIAAQGADDALIAPGSTGEAAGVVIGIAGYEDGAGTYDAGIDECTHASRLIGLTLEVEDIIPSAYVLEVSTPGLDRKFFSPEQFERFQGRFVELALEEPVAEWPGRKRFTGIISAIQSAEATADWNLTLNLCEASAIEQGLEVFAGILECRWGNIKRARLVYVVPPKPGTPAPKKRGTETKKKKK